MSTADDRYRHAIRAAVSEAGLTGPGHVDWLEGTNGATPVYAEPAHEFFLHGYRAAEIQSILRRAQQVCEPLRTPSFAPPQDTR